MIDAASTLRALVVARFGDLMWRHHGIGVLQAYLAENTEPEVRVHVWDPRLVKPGIREAGDIHDHRFDLESTILVGSIEERFYGVAFGDPNGTWSVFHVENARSAGAERNFDGACFVIDGAARFAVERYDRFVYDEGDSYSHPRGTFHRTIVTGLAVTVCVMREKRGSARLLVPYGREPVHAFGEAAPPEVQLAILHDALVALRARA